MNSYDHLVESATRLLCSLIAIPSVSRDENAAADCMESFMRSAGMEPRRIGNNLLLGEDRMVEGRKTILLNAHIDTVKPAATWTYDPFTATREGDMIYGLGSNDCGGGLVSLLMAYQYLSQRPQKYNLLYLASAEEEVSGAEGIRKVLPLLPVIDVAIVGEPTGMQPAIAERGLMVLDLEAKGKSGHAARNEGVNAIYEMLRDLQWIHDFKFAKVSPYLGPTSMQLTVINAGTQHNVVPDVCKAIVDVRTNEFYDNEDVFAFIQSNLKSSVKARSFHLKSSRISEQHPLVTWLTARGKQPFGSPTLSDQALMSFPSFKLGPGQSSRSHSADEYITIPEISDAITTYIEMLDGFTF